MKTVDLNCDLGESFGNYTIGLDDKVIPFISSANIACGYHAGDACVMDKTVAMCKAAGVSCGAHPGFPDLMGFGRRTMKVSPTEAKDYIIYQVGALKAFCEANGTKLNHVKPHGAMYNMAGKDHELALAIALGIKAVDPDLIMLGLSGSELLKAAEEVGLPCASEVFADRAYEDDGSLVARSKEGAVIKDAGMAVSKVIGMIKNGTVTSINGKVIPIKADSVCVHGDNEKALDFVTMMRVSLKNEGIGIEPMHN